MLQDFEILLKSNSLYYEVDLGAIAHSCCTASQKKVVDFDRVKDDFCTTLGVKKLKSVDAICLSKANDTLYLIEMKAYSPLGSLSCDHFIDNHFGKFSLANKIADSIFIILGILGYFSVTRTFYNYFFDPTRLKIKTFLLTNLTYADIVGLSLATLDKQRIGLTKRIDGDTLIVNCVDIERIL